MPRGIPRREVQQALSLVQGLRSVPFRPTGRATDRYNCIAWALHDTSRFWWPGGDPGLFLEEDGKPCNYWPARLTEPDPASNLGHFLDLFAEHGFQPCQDGNLQKGVEKLVLYTQSYRDIELFQHVARQLPTGRWTSKLGRLIVIEHATPEDLCEEYGTTLLFLHRPRPPRSQRRRL